MSKQRIDMIAQAQAAQRADDPENKRGAIKVIAPAKVNLFLGIGERRDDGFHDVLNVLHAVTLHDELYMRRVSSQEVQTTTDASEAQLAGPHNNVYISLCCFAREGLDVLPVSVKDNIVFRAIDELTREVGYDKQDALELRLDKHIPHQAGLGGGSSDAAAALVGAARLFGIPVDHPALERIAHRLGSDVAFFLHGGCAYFDGAGEHFDHTLIPMKRSLVLFKPQAGLSTAAAYHEFDKCPAPIDNTKFDAAFSAKRAEEVPLFNNLATASERLMPQLSDVKNWAKTQPGVDDVLLCGSGSTSFAVTQNNNVACRLAAAARAQGWWARTTSFGPVKASIVE